MHEALERAPGRGWPIKGICTSLAIIAASRYHSRSMGHSKASIVVGLALVITVAICQVQLPCDSPLRPLPSLAIFFQHCDSLCRYNDWTDLIPYPHARPVPVPWYQCRSELAIYGERLQIPNNYHECTESMCETCETRREEGFVCNSTCRYSNWTELTPLNTSILTPVVVPQNVCLSGLGIPGERWQFAISGYECVGIRCGECMNKREERYICTCHYSNWTELLPTTTETVVPQTKCLSELGIQQVRWQFAISGYECTQTQCQECQDKMEENYICNSTCHYSNWTDVTPLVNATPIAVPYNQCSSQEASLGERWQFAISGYECEGSQCKECEDRKEERHICKIYVHMHVKSQVYTHHKYPLWLVCFFTMLCVPLSRCTDYNRTDNISF